MLAALAGSTKMPSFAASHACAARISASVTMSIAAVACRDGGGREFPARGIADADRGGDGFGFLDDSAVENRRRARGLEADHLRQARGASEPVKLFVAHPVGADVARIADRQDVNVGRVAEHFDDLERRGLLALETIRIDRIDDGDRLGLADLAHEPQRVVEIAVDGHDLRAIHEGLRELAESDLARRQQDDAGDARARRIGRRRGAGVAGAGADHRFCAPASTAFESATVMPRSLNEPVGFSPSYLMKLRSRARRARSASANESAAWSLRSAR